MAEKDSFYLKIICPEGVFYKGNATRLEMNTSEGYMGVYAKHAPTTVLLRPGLLTITTEKGVHKAKVSEGFVEIVRDAVTVMAEEISVEEKVDINI